MSVVVTLRLNGVPVPVEVDDQALVAIAAALPTTDPEAAAQESPYMTIREASEYLRCSRQRVDDLLSQRRLTRVKDGRRTLISRAELEAHLGRF